MVAAVFTKRDPTAPPGFFAVEAAGLDWLRQATAAGGPHVPEVVTVDDTHISMTRIEPGPWTEAVDERFGRALAALHARGAPSFGWADHPQGFIGPLPQSNEPACDWPTFYAERRLRPVAHAAIDRGALSGPDAQLVEQVCERIADLAGPAEPPARIHGDLWRGNALADRAGTPWLVDPAAHGGHRETDLAMMRLFGGFGERAYAAYREVTPLADGWPERVALHQLHPLLVHTVLFGGAYAAQAATAARHALRA